MTSKHLAVSEKLSRLSLTSDGDEAHINVLLVEDSKTVRAQLREYIALLNNVTLIETDTLAEARNILEARSHELFCAILDLTLPDATGLETVEAASTYDVPIIVLTGSVDPYLRQAVLDLRVIDYMFKNGAAAIEDVAYLIGRLRQNQTMKVLVVDDSRTYQLHVSRLLAQYRFPVMAAGDGQEALNLLEHNPDIALVLTDYHMPGMNGLELVRRIRRHHRREDLAIIALSNIDRPELSAAMLKAGANDYLDKKCHGEEFYCRVVQNTNMVRFVRELRDMSNRDYLTQLHNRRFLFHAAEVLHAEMSGSSLHHLAVAMVDVDHFKRINDEYGHPAGDEVLRQIADLLRRSFSRPNIVARYGGEEFVCVVRADDLLQVTHHFEMLRADIAAIPLMWEGTQIRLTVSIGVTTAKDVTFVEMVDQADQALFRAKAEGRNRVVIFPANGTHTLGNG